MQLTTFVLLGALATASASPIEKRQGKLRTLWAGYTSNCPAPAPGQDPFRISAGSEFFAAGDLPQTGLFEEGFIGAGFPKRSANYIGVRNVDDRVVIRTITRPVEATGYATDNWAFDPVSNVADFQRPGDPASNLDANYHYNPAETALFNLFPCGRYNVNAGRVAEQPVIIELIV